jgi:hypothetical protein
MDKQRGFVVVVDDTLQSKPSRRGGGLSAEAVQTACQGGAGALAQDANPVRVKLS